MRVEIKKVYGTWRDVADNANNTVGKEDGTKEPSYFWKKRMLLSEHSPIRTIRYRIKIYDIPYWVAMHFVRHKVGVEHWVKTQRTDRTGADRSQLKQDALIDYVFEANQQALINMSRKRICNKAAKETRTAWYKVLSAILLKDATLWEVLVPECVYRGNCYEMITCGSLVAEGYKATYRRTKK